MPCSLVGDAIAALETHPRLPYVPAVREDVAVGLAAGAWMAGRLPMVIMQNSGLGTSLNALVSLSLMYRVPALLLVTWRGHGGKDAPEHLVMGDISPRLLELIAVPHRVLTAGSVAADIAWARAEAERLSQPVALLLPPGVMAPREHAEHVVGKSTRGGESLSIISGGPEMAPALPPSALLALPPVSVLPRGGIAGRCRPRS